MFSVFLHQWEFFPVLCFYHVFIQNIYRVGFSVTISQDLFACPYVCFDLSLSLLRSAESLNQLELQSMGISTNFLWFSSYFLIISFCTYRSLSLSLSLSLSRSLSLTHTHTHTHSSLFLCISKSFLLGNSLLVYPKFCLLSGGKIERMKLICLVERFQ